MKQFLSAGFVMAALLVLGASPAVAATQKTLRSPDGSLLLTVTLDEGIRYDVSLDGHPVMTGNTLSLRLGDRTLGTAPKLSRATVASVDETLQPLHPMRFSSVRNHYNQLTLKFRNGYTVEFRAYDDGIAYRFVTALPGQVEVMDEEIGIGLPADSRLTLQQCAGFKTAYEEPYVHPLRSEWTPEEPMAHLPILAQLGDGCNVLISESGLQDYPAAFFRSDGSGLIRSVFPPEPLEFGPDSARIDRSVSLTRLADYIARTDGTRAFPWRYFVVTREDADLLTTTMTCRLAEPCALTDTDWIRSGQAAWDWWNGGYPYGPDVNFKAGRNQDTYKYFIDFAAHYGLQYIVMDEGWAKNTRDPLTPNANVDVEDLARYGRQKGVGIVLWVPWVSVENTPEIFATYERWGVAGMKIDFMDRSDQWMVNYYERVAAEAARHHLIVNFHGAFKPAGLEYKYPNVLSYEGVRGMEMMAGCTPANSIYLPFLRNATGPMEYTPGAMVSMQPESYASRRPHSASIGTRAYQMALFIVFESALQMLADSPTQYYNNDDCTRFITRVPVCWDETVPLAARVGDYAVVAKRRGDRWFIGGMTADRKEHLVLDLPLDFLPAGRSWTMTSYEDGINADRQAMDFRKKTTTVRSGDRIHIDMARNGGFAAILE